MTTAGYGPHLRRASARPVRQAPTRLTLRHGHRRLHWWHGRLVLGAAIAGAMVGAVLGVADAVISNQLAPVEAMRHYGIGAGLGLLVGLAVGVVLSLLVALTTRYLLPQSVRPRRVWVRYRRDG